MGGRAARGTSAVRVFPLACFTADVQARKELMIQAASIEIQRQALRKQADELDLLARDVSVSPRARARSVSSRAASRSRSISKVRSVLHRMQMYGTILALMCRAMLKPASLPWLLRLAWLQSLTMLTLMQCTCRTPAKSRKKRNPFGNQLEVRIYRRAFLREALFAEPKCVRAAATCRPRCG